jgi:hypothetical protein
MFSLMLKMFISIGRTNFNVHNKVFKSHCLGNVHIKNSHYFLLSWNSHQIFFSLHKNTKLNIFGLQNWAPHSFFAEFKIGGFAILFWEVLCFDLGWACNLCRINPKWIIGYFFFTFKVLNIVFCGLQESQCKIVNRNTCCGFAVHLF